MGEIAGFHVDEIEFTRDGPAADPGRADAFVGSVEQREPTDLLVLAHGWNNDMAQARTLFAAWLEVARAAIPRQGWGPEDRTIDVLAVLWPSKKFADADLIAGGAAGLVPQPAGDDVAALVAQIDVLDDLASPSELDELRSLAPRLAADRAARDRFVEISAQILDRTEADIVAGSDALPAFDTPDGTLLERLRDPAESGLPPAPGDEGGAAVLGTRPEAGPDGGAAGISDLWHDAVGAARDLLNYLTYYTMKNRAGLVGRRGVAPILARLEALPKPPRVHLVGHSFGARLATAAVLGPEAGAPNAVNTLVLLQAAFSHNAFAQDFDGPRDGAFRSVVAPSRCVRGPIMITHTHNDTAVGIAYAIASRIAHQDAALIGGPEDRYGGLGRNGAVHTPEAFGRPMLPVGKDYEALDQHEIHNLLADQFIGGHGDVRGPEVGEIIVQALAAT